MALKAAFFDAVRTSLFAGRLSTAQVEGMEALERAWAARGDGNNQRLAYILGTAYHETARTMQPIYERGAKAYFNKYEPGTKIGKALGNTLPGDGYLFRGRGHVQLTGRANYVRAGKAVGLDLAAAPDRALDISVSAHICVVGCMEGWFTGKDLSDYIDDLDEADAEDLREFANARRVVNGTDKAAAIAGYALLFEKALKASKYTANGPAPTVAPPTSASPKRKTLSDLFKGWFVQQATTKIASTIVKETKMSSNLFHNILNIAIAIVAILSLPEVVAVLPPDVGLALVGIVGVLKTIINIARDGFSGLFKEQPPVR